jgi:hypothetical protein
MRDLVRRLLAASPTASDPQTHEAVRVFETLRTHLTRLVGADGFASLLRRALAVASAEIPALAGVKLSLDGHLEGMEAISPDSTAALAAHLLGLLETFIGEGLTLRLVREAWPDTKLDE